MESIVHNLGDPSWWFTVVIVGILASVAAAYFRSWLDTILAKLSASLKLRKQLREEKRRRFAELLLSDSALLIIEFIRTAIACVLFASVLIIYIFATIVWNLSDQSGEEFLFEYVSIGSGVALIFLIYVAMVKVGFSHEVLKEYLNIAGREQ